MIRATYPLITAVDGSVSFDRLSAESSERIELGQVVGVELSGMAYLVRVDNIGPGRELTPRRFGGAILRHLGPADRVAH